MCGDVQWTYGEFDAVCNALAHGLLGVGVGVGDRVAVLSRNSHAFAALRFALARLGAVLVPINFMLTAHEVAYVLKHAGARLLCAGPDMLDLARDARHARPRSRRSSGFRARTSRSRRRNAVVRCIAAHDSRAGGLEIDGRSLAQIVYTSGTESAPKGAMLTHDAVIWQYVSCIVDGEIARANRLLHALPLYHCAQLDVFLGPGDLRRRDQRHHRDSRRPTTCCR